MSSLDIEIKQDLVCELITFVKSNSRLSGRSKPEGAVLTICYRIIHDGEPYKASRTDWLIQELKKTPTLWAKFSRFLANSSGECNNCPHRYYNHNRNGIACIGGYKYKYSKPDVSCDCVGFVNKPL